MFYQLIRILKKHPNSEDVVERTMQVLKRFASLEEHIIKAVENDVVGMQIWVSSLLVSQPLTRNTRLR